MALNYYIFWNFFFKTYCFRIKEPLNIRLETAVIECHYTPLRIILSSGFYCLAGCGSNTTPLGNIPITCIARRPAMITCSQSLKNKIIDDPSHWRRCVYSLRLDSIAKSTLQAQISTSFTTISIRLEVSSIHRTTKPSGVTHRGSNTTSVAGGCTPSGLQPLKP